MVKADNFDQAGGRKRVSAAKRMRMKKIYPV